MTVKRRQTIKYLTADYLMLNIGWLAFNIIRFWSLPLAYPLSLYTWLCTPQCIIGQILFPLMIIAAYGVTGFYQKVIYKSRLAELGNTTFVSFGTTLVIYFTVLINDGIPERMTNYELLLTLFLLLTVPTYCARLLITHRTNQRIRSGELAFNVFIVGAGRGAIELAKRLDGYLSHMGMRVIGYIDPDGHALTPDMYDRPLYPIDKLQELCAEHQVNDLIIMPNRSGMRCTIDCINQLFPMEANLFVPADIYQLVTVRGPMISLVGEPLINISSARIRPSTANLKRIMDIVGSTLALIVLSPLLLVLAVAVKIDSRGPVLYRQERIGYRKKPFKINKFRTMYVNAEDAGPALSSTDDPRVTRLGRTLRKYRLDELPQFWNVLIGEMSIVGPRPERSFYIDQIVSRAPYYSLVHQVRPGITSLGMVKYGYATCVDQMLERLRYDILYLENISIANDIKILLHTVHTVCTGRGI